MINFKYRSYQLELLDREDIPFNDIKLNMQELNKINAKLGGHKISINGIKKLINHSFKQCIDKTIQICEIGCGGGDNLRVIKKWCKKNKINATFIGIDINENCIHFAQSLAENKDISFVCSDYKTVEFQLFPDIIFSSLFCHHLTNKEFTEMINWSNANAKVGFFINDLHRHSIAYFSIKMLTTIFSKSYLVKNDAPLSVLRGFTKNELITLLNSSTNKNYTIQWKWAFRWLVCSYNNIK
jgi:2-polyprenyl-3-methyl-5-hydroxy-6-metoxy-1,4-benzoquinol methylase